MLNEFPLYSKFPTTNRDLMQSSYAGGQDIFLSCNSKIATATRDLPQRLIFVRVPSNMPVMVAEPKLREAIKAATQQDLTTLPEHHKNFCENPHTPPRTLSLGGFLLVQQGESIRRHFVVQRNGAQNNGLWSPPSVMASQHPYAAMAQAVNNECGVVAVNDVDRTVTVMAPYIKMPNGKYPFMTEVIGAFDSVAMKRLQENTIVSALAEQGLGDYKLLYQAVPAELMTGAIPLRDEINFSYPSGQFEHTDIIKGYGVKDKYGSFNIHMPFMVRLPENVRLVTIDCQGQGRKTALFNDAEMHALHEMGAVTAAMGDLMRRPQPVNREPALDKPAPPPVAELRRVAIA